MPVHDYTSGDGPGGFMGYRVTAWDSGQGVQRQRYFSTRGVTARERREIRRAADELDAQWHSDQRRARKALSPNATDVRGILATFSCRSRRGADGWTYYDYTPVFRAQGANSGVRFSKSFSVARLGVEGAWHAAVEYRAKQKGLRRWRHQLHLCPTAEQFRRIRRQMNGQGHRVPAARLPAAA